MLNEKGLIFCTFYVIISGKAAGWCVKRFEGTFPDIPGEHCSPVGIDSSALSGTSSMRGGNIGSSFRGAGSRKAD